jgi:phytoene dehydrogenase-like protein
MTDQFDAIIIGSGIGGLTAASLLAQEKKYKVLVIEKHYRIGGFTHTFSRPGGYTWDVGLHYVGEMNKGSQIRNIFDKITQGKVQWARMKDPFEVFCYPGFTFEIHSDSKTYEQNLINLFPLESKAIRQYFKDVRSVARAYVLFYGPRAIRKLLSFIFFRIQRMANSTLKFELDKRFQDNRLKSVLASQWGDYGLPPSQSSFFIHASIVNHYLNGGYYPVGGAGSIAQSIQQIVESQSGKILSSHEVTEILLEGDKAIGVQVKLKNGSTESYFASEIYSDAGAKNTFLKLLPPRARVPFRADLENENSGISCVTLYLGLKEDPSILGIHGQNFWIYKEWDHDEMFSKNSELLKGEPLSCFLSFPSMKDPEAKAHTAECIAFVDYEPFKSWAEMPWKKRGHDYDELKRKISEGLIQLVETRIPGFASNIAYQELSTPLTVEHFTHHPRGQIYGLAHNAKRFSKEYHSARTPIQNLFLVGADVTGCGIVGAMMGGVLGVAAKHGFSMLGKVTKKS